MNPTQKARQFMLANAESPVVYGSVDGKKITYRLENNKRFDLTKQDCQSLPIYPHWAL